VTERIAVRFRRVESRLTARAFAAGLLPAVERKNCRWLAQQAGHRSPRRMQPLLDEAVWDAEAVRDDVRAFVIEQLAHLDAVLICDETGFLKKGRASAGCSGSTPAPRDASRTARSRYSCPPRRRLTAP
jgi:SRSO17 transposase